MPNANTPAPTPERLPLPDHLAALTAKERAFVEARLQGGAVGDAALAAGYAHRESGYAVQRRPHVRKAIDIEFEDLRISCGPELWAKLMGLTDAGKDATRLDAVKTALDRIGIAPGRILDVKHTHSLESLSQAELDAQIARLLAELPEHRRALYAGELKALPSSQHAEQPIDATYADVTLTDETPSAAVSEPPQGVEPNQHEQALAQALADVGLTLADLEDDEAGDA